MKNNGVAAKICLVSAPFPPHSLPIKHNSLDFSAVLTINVTFPQQHPWRLAEQLKVTVKHKEINHVQDQNISRGRSTREGR